VLQQDYVFTLLPYVGQQFGICGVVVLGVRLLIDVAQLDEPAAALPRLRSVIGPGKEHARAVRDHYLQDASPCVGDDKSSSTDFLWAVGHVIGKKGASYDTR